MNNVFETQRIDGDYPKMVRSYDEFLADLTAVYRGFVYEDDFRFFINGQEMADYVEAVIWSDTHHALNIKEDVEFKKPLRSDCTHCGGYGYTQAVGTNWTMLDFIEFLCPHCEEETF